MNWYEKEPSVFSPVISTRVRFARNLENTPFPHLLSEEKKETVWDKITSALEEKNMQKIPFAGLDPLVKQSFVDGRIASRNFLSAEKGAGLLLSPDGDVSIMVNEEDHLRLQVLMSGKALRAALEKAKEYALFCEEKLPIAYREKLGYLTSCPTNLGSACRISAMVHLPALSAMGAIGPLAEKLLPIGYTVRGAFGEGSLMTEGILQISNQNKGDTAPEKIAEDFEKILLDLRDREGRAGAKILKDNPWEIKDRICRAIGTLRYAKKISYKEFLSLFSLVRFGKALGIDEAREMFLPDRFLTKLSASHLLLSDLSLENSEERDVLRARKLREANP